MAAPQEGETLPRSLSGVKAVEGRQFPLFDPADSLPDDAALAGHLGREE